MCETLCVATFESFELQTTHFRGTRVVPATLIHVFEIGIHQETTIVSHYHRFSPVQWQIPRQVAEITVLRNRMQQMERENLRLENATWHRKNTVGKPFERC